jgi:hypothetical protein
MFSVAHSRFAPDDDEVRPALRYVGLLPVASCLQGCRLYSDVAQHENNSMLVTGMLVSAFAFTLISGAVAIGADNRSDQRESALMVGAVFLMLSLALLA